MSARALAALLAGTACALGGCGAAAPGAAGQPHGSAATAAATAPGAAVTTQTTADAAAAVALDAAHATAADSAGPAGAVAAGTALAPQQVLARALEDTPGSLDPPLAPDYYSMEVVFDLFEGLVCLGHGATPAPCAASSWSVSPDGLTWTFHLRADARWSNGAPVTAGDFVFAWRREIDPHIGAQYAEAFLPFVNGAAIIAGKKPADALGVEAADTHTLVIHLVHPAPYLLGQLGQPYMDPAYPPAVSRYGGAWVQPGHIVCNGAFVLTENVLGSRITLDKNPYYWDTAHVHLTRVVYYIITDPAQAALRFLAGDVQYTDLFDQQQYAYLQRRLGAQVIAAPEFATYMLAVNFQLPPFRDNRALREALTISVDRAALARYVLQGVNEPAYTLMPDLPGYPQPVPAWAGFDKARRDALARRLYREAGYSRRHPLRVDIDTANQGPALRHFYEAIAATWNSVLGADVGVHEEEYKVLLQDRQLHKLPLFFDGWSGDYLDPFTYLQLFQSDNEFNDGGYSNPRYDALVDQATRTADPAARYRLFAQAEKLLNDDVVYIPLYYYADRHLIKPYVKGWQSNLLDVMPSRYLYILQHQGR